MPTKWKLLQKQQQQQQNSFSESEKALPNEGPFPFSEDNQTHEGGAPPAGGSSIFRFVAPVLVAILFGAAILVLHQELRSIRYRDVVAGISSISRAAVYAAILLTILNYAVMTGYDALAFRYLNHPLPYRKIAFTSFIGYAFSNTLGMSMLAGSSVRYRLYSSWGVSGKQVARCIFFATVTLWLGLFAIAGLSFIVNGVAVDPSLHLPVRKTFPLGVLFLSVVVSYLSFTATRQSKPLKIFRWRIALPSLRIATAQIALASLDWALAGAVLYALIPQSTKTTFPIFLTTFLLAQVAGLISQVPGGVGVFETTLILLTPGGATAQFLGSLLIFRIVYYIVPLLTAAILLGWREALAQREGLRRVSAAASRFLPQFVPRFFALTTFLSGTVLLISGATPGVVTRLQWLDKFLPLPVLEISHFLGSLAGAGLLVLSRGIQRRLHVAYYMSLFLLAAGAIFSLLKGFDYEEAAFLSIMLIALLPSRRYFYRQAPLFGEKASPLWLASALVVLLGSTWLVFFAYKHVEYSHELWWNFSLNQDAPRSLRAMVGAIVLLIALGAKMMSERTQSPPARTRVEELFVAEPIVKSCRRTSSYLALMGDKSLLFNAAQNGFVMYGVRNNTWVSMGDPVGPDSEAEGLIWQFLEECDEADAKPAFYEVEHRRLHLYLDAGLSLLKIGEEARVYLPDFSLAGNERKNMRYIRNKLSRAGFTFEIISREEVEGMLPELKKVSDAWLTQKNTREKGFSMGFFKEDYLVRLPMALVRKEREIFAFANILEGGDHEELSVDLMRYLPGQTDMMEYLFLELMLWGQKDGYRWFNLGMAPLSGLGHLPSRSGWNRLGHFLFRYGEHFYNFQGLREYKEKFGPVWEPRYLAYPGGLTLPRVLADIASLIAGGFKGVVGK